MSQEYPKPYDVANTLYHAAVLAGLAGVYSMVGKKLIKFDIGDPSKDYEAILKLTVPIVLAQLLEIGLSFRDFCLQIFQKIKVNI
jgi:hypothetical protein